MTHHSLMPLPSRRIARPIVGVLGLAIATGNCVSPRAGSAPPESRSGALDSLDSERVSPGIGQRLDSLLTAYEKEGFSGAVLIVHHQRLLLSKGYGFANKNTRVRNSPATRYELNSLTKMFTAASILQLAAQGKLHLDDPIERHLGPFPTEKKAATIEQLAMHTAGLTVAGSDVGAATRDAFVDRMKRAPIESVPGAKYRYTNAGYSMLAAIVEVASGQKYTDYLRQHIFAPADMKYATFRNLVPSSNPLFASGYAPRDTTGAPAEVYEWGTIGAGGVWSTMGDVYRWVIAVEKGTVIPPQYSTLLHSPPRPPSLEAYGWHVYPATDTTGRRIEKGGGSEDFATQLLQFPNDEAVIIWASNDLSVKRWRQTLNRELPRMLLGFPR